MEAYIGALLGSTAPLTLLLDCAGLVLMSWPLFRLHEPVKFVFSQEVGVIGDLVPVADAINEIRSDVGQVGKMRVGLAVLLSSLGVKIISWAIASCS